jgi:hydroxymethylglutaryl-CoA synthase
MLDDGSHMRGLVAYGAYVPYNRLDRGRIKEVLGSGGGRGTRAVASYDEDTTSMGVEAGLAAVRSLDDRRLVTQLFFATAAPPYADKTNATAIHAALQLPAECLAVDMAGSVRSGVGAIVAASQSPVPTMAILSDVRTGLPGGADERDGGDAAAAFVFGGSEFGNGDELPVLAELLSHASASEEFLDRWRAPGTANSRVWEERFGEHAYVGMVDSAVGDALKQASATADEVDYLIVAGLHGRAVKHTVNAIGVRPEAVVDDLVSTIGNSGTAQAGVLLADVLDRAAANERILLVILADGVSAFILQTTAALPSHRQARSVASQIADGNTALSYATFLSWRGFLDREPPRRPDPDAPAGPPSARRRDWKFGLVASRCTECGARSLPPGRVCPQCRSTDQMTPEPLADVAGTVTTYTIDHLAYTPSPPMLVVVVDFDGGGRFRCQLTDAAPEQAQIGLRVEMTFRRLVTAAGIHNYFWKARPIRTVSDAHAITEAHAGSVR